MKTYSRSTITVLALAPSSLASEALAQSKTILYPGEYLAVGQYLVSPNRRTFAIQQDDGHFVVYEGSGPNAQKDALWWTGKYARGGDGNGGVRGQEGDVLHGHAGGWKPLHLPRQRTQ